MAGSSGSSHGWPMRGNDRKEERQGSVRLPWTQRRHHIGMAQDLRNAAARMAHMTCSVNASTTQAYMEYDIFG